jgi:putative ABC transport system permease protein
MGNSILVEGDDLRPDPSRPPRPIVMFTAVAGGYIEAMRMRLKVGRTLDRGDVDRGELDALVNEAFVKAYFPSEDPIGHRIASSRPSNSVQPHWLTIVGVVGNTPLAALAEANPTPKVYLPMSIGGGPGIPGTMLLGPNVAVMSYVVRTAIPPLGLAPAVRRAIDTVDADLALSDVRSLQDIVDRASADMAFTMVLIAIAGSVALLLGIIGIYGVMSFVVSQRTSEIGVRMALGAEPGNVARMIVRQGGAVTLVGITIGLACALATSRFIGSLLYGVSPREPAIFAVTAASLAVVALVACWVPARRAARLSPMAALRSE